MTTRGLVVSAVAVLVSIAAIGCGGGGDPVRIGVLTDCQGLFRAWKEAELSAAELPLLRRGASLVGPAPTDGITPATVAGRRVELVAGCSEIGDETVFIDEVRRLVEEEHVDAVIGGASVVTREVARRYPEVPFLATTWDEQEVTLRRPAPNLYRFTLDYGQRAAGLGAYAYESLGWRRATIVAGDGPLGWGPSAAFVAEFCALGGKVDAEVYRSPYEPDPDRTLASRALAARSDGVAAFFTALDSATGVVADLLRRLDRPQDRLLLWGPQLDSEFLTRLGAKLDGVALTWPYPTDRASRQLSDYAARYRAAFPRMKAGVELLPFVMDYADSVEAFLTALGQAGGDLSDGRRRLGVELAKLRLALPRGDVRLDENRQAVADVPLVRLGWRQGKPVPRPISTAHDVEQTFGGLLSHAPPPGPGSQPCRKATPPPWARKLK